MDNYLNELSQTTGLKSGTLYPILMRLCDRGLLESQWQAAVQAGRPPRHVYRLTAAGTAFARSAMPLDAGRQKRAAPSGEFA